VQQVSQVDIRKRHVKLVPDHHLRWVLPAAYVLMVGGCAAATDDGVVRGQLVLRTVSTGHALDIDADGYQIAGLPGGPVLLGANDSVTEQVPPGDYRLGLSGFTDNCLPSATEQAVIVRAGEPVEARWDLDCGLTPGQLAVAFDIQGSSGNGAATITIDGGQPLTVPAGDTVAVGSLPPHSHRLTITATTPNCRVTLGATQHFSITRHERTTFVLPGYCAPGIMVFDQTTTLPGDTIGTRHLFRMNADSSNIQEFDFSGPGNPYGREPALSPDGTQIAFVYRDELTGASRLATMRIDGTALRFVTQMINMTGPAWSPDGAFLAFSAAPGIGFEVYTVGVDGSNLRNLTNHPDRDHYPTWSPDGGTIAFSSNRSGVYEVYLIGVDGSGLVALTQNGGVSPAWAPTGNRLAFRRNNAVWLINSDGSSPQLLTGETARVKSELTWSPDGRFLAYGEHGPGGGIEYLPVDGSPTITITRPEISSFNGVSWGP